MHSSTLIRTQAARAASYGRALRGTQKHTQEHSEALRGIQEHSEALRGKHMPSHAIPQRRTVRAHPLMREAITGHQRPSQAIKHVVPSEHVRAADEGGNHRPITGQSQAIKGDRTCRARPSRR